MGEINKTEVYHFVIFFKNFYNPKTLGFLDVIVI